jgi:hypothetical protein
MTCLTCLTGGRVLVVWQLFEKNIKKRILSKQYLQKQKAAVVEREFPDQENLPLIKFKI